MSLSVLQRFAVPLIPYMNSVLINSILTYYYSKYSLYILYLTLFLLPFPRHPTGRAYFDPNDFLEGIHQEIEREELEYEVI